MSFQNLTFNCYIPKIMIFQKISCVDINLKIKIIVFLIGIINPVSEICSSKHNKGLIPFDVKLNTYQGKILLQNAKENYIFKHAFF